MFSMFQWVTQGFCCCYFNFFWTNMTQVMLAPKSSVFLFTQSCPCLSSYSGSPILLVPNLTRNCEHTAFHRWILHAGHISYLTTLSLISSPKHHNHNVPEKLAQTPCYTFYRNPNRIFMLTWWIKLGLSVRKLFRELCPSTVSLSSEWLPVGLAFHPKGWYNINNSHEEPLFEQG